MHGRGDVIDSHSQEKQEVAKMMKYCLAQLHGIQE